MSKNQGRKRSSSNAHRDNKRAKNNKTPSKGKGPKGKKRGRNKVNRKSRQIFKEIL